MTRGRGEDREVRFVRFPAQSLPWDRLGSDKYRRADCGLRVREDDCGRVGTWMPRDQRAGGVNGWRWCGVGIRVSAELVAKIPSIWPAIWLQELDKEEILPPPRHRHALNRHVQVSPQSIYNLTHQISNMQQDGTHSYSPHAPFPPPTTPSQNSNSPLKASKSISAPTISAKSLRFICVKTLLNVSYKFVL